MEIKEPKNKYETNNLGYIKLFRQIIESDIWLNKPPWWLKVWLYILIKVNHTDNGMFKQGENYFTYADISRDCRLQSWGIKTQSLDNVMAWMRQGGMITTRRTIHGVVISVSNFADFQGFLGYTNDTRNDAVKSDESPTKVRRNATINNNERIKELKSTVLSVDKGLETIIKIFEETTGQILTSDDYQCLLEARDNYAVKDIEEAITASKDKDRPARYMLWLLNNPTKINKNIKTAYKPTDNPDEFYKRYAHLVKTKGE